WRSIEATAPSFGVRLTPADVQGAAEIERAMEAREREPNGGVIVLPGPITIAHRELITALAARHRLPAAYAFRFFVTGGGLLSYGIDSADQTRQAAGYVDRILRGKKPGDLPVQRDQSQDREGARSRRSAHAARARRRGDRMKAVLLRCMSPEVARSGVSLRCQCLTAIGGKADIGRASRSCRSGAIDPGCVKTHTSAKWRKHNSPARHQASRVQYDLTPRDAIARRYFYVWRDC